MAILRQSVATLERGLPSKIGFVALVYIDLVLTLFAIQHGFSEINPFMVQMLSRVELLVLAKVVAPLFIAWFVPAKFLLPSIGFMVIVLGWNIATLVTSI